MSKLDFSIIKPIIDLIVEVVGKKFSSKTIQLPFLEALIKNKRKLKITFSQLRQFSLLAN